MKQALSTLLIVLASFFFITNTGYANQSYSYDQFKKNYAKTHPSTRHLAPRKHQQATQQTEQPIKLIKFKDPVQFNETLIAGFVVLALFLWYIKRRSLHPKHATISANSTPPTELSPAAFRMLIRKSYDHRTFTTALITLANKGAIRISHNQDGYHIEKISDGTKLTDAEKELLNHLFTHHQSITINASTRKILSSGSHKLKHALKLELIGRYLINNTAYWLAGICCTLLLLMGEIYQQSIDQLETTKELIGVSIPFILLIVMTISIVHVARSLWRELRKIHSRNVSFLKVFIRFTLLVFLIAFSSAWSTPIIQETTPWTPAIIALLTLVNLYSCGYLRAYTEAGVRQVEMGIGYKYHLETSMKETQDKHADIKTNETLSHDSAFLAAFDLPNNWIQTFDQHITRFMKSAV